MSIPIRTWTFQDIIYRFLLALAVFLALVLIGGTLYSLFFRQQDTVSYTGNSRNGAVENERAQSERALNERTFTSIGQMRLSLAESGPLVILNISFPYNQNDWPFTEELAGKIDNFRTITGQYFLTFSLFELEEKSEDEIKAELLARFNDILRLGKIEILYFSDFMIIK